VKNGYLYKNQFVNDLEKIKELKIQNISYRFEQEKSLGKEIIQ